jgi:hypothetical protein
MDDTATDAGRTRLRSAVSEIDRQLRDPTAPLQADVLGRSWTQLVGLLALGPEPELRVCPRCKSQGMKDATRCGYCWQALTPPN